MVVIVLLRTRGIRIYHYLNDILILARTRQHLLSHLDIVLHTLMEFGWLVNLEKSVLEQT